MSNDIKHKSMLDIINDSMEKTLESIHTMNKGAKNINIINGLDLYNDVKASSKQPKFIIAIY